MLVAALVLLVWVVRLTVDPAGEGSSGTGLTYDGEFYLLSGAQVRPDRLGPVLADDVAFQDTTTQLRAITGVRADVAVAALLDVPRLGSARPQQAWQLLSPEPDLAADPWSDGLLSLAVQPDASRDGPR